MRVDEGKYQDPMKSAIAVIRLESHWCEEGVLMAASSFTSWLRSFSAQASRLLLVLPIERSRLGLNPSGEGGYPLRTVDRLYGVPSCRGFIRAYLNLPIILWQVLRVRMRTRLVIVRAPEHLNLVLLPLLWILRFRIVLWLVHDRAATALAERARRSMSQSLRLGLLLNRATGSMERLFLSRSIVVANGSALAQFARQAGAPAEMVCTAISTNMSAESLPVSRPVLPRTDKSVTLLYVGRVAVEKGLGDLLVALARLNEVARHATFRDVRLQIVGVATAAELARLEAQALKLSLRSSVDFLGHVPFGPVLFRLYEEAHLFVIPSWVEGTPRVLTEAMAFGRPIVATTVGGIPDVVTHERNALLVPPRQPEELARALHRLITDRALAERMAEANWRDASKFTVERFTQAFADHVAAADARARVQRS